ncbi:hypothetical protein [Paenibacillus sp. FSL R5-0810]|uniref:hypothetical protein n=1 Tax=Paenibacillus sp. FSL R5-0810 TaxID=2921659 RepID=UPI0030F9206E
MLSMLIKKCISGIAASFIFTSVMALVMMNLHYGFTFYIVVVGIYSVMIMLLIGVPISIGIELILQRIRPRKAIVQALITVALYGVLGLLVSMLIFSDASVNFGQSEHLLYWTFGVGAALVFMIVDIIVKKLI